MKHRIVIDLYDHTKGKEIDEILQALKDIGIDNARYEVYKPGA